MTINHTNREGFDNILCQVDRDHFNVAFPDFNVIRLDDCGNYEMRFAVPGYLESEILIHTVDDVLNIYTCKDFGQNDLAMLYVKKFIPHRVFHLKFAMPKNSTVSRCLLYGGILHIGVSEVEVVESPILHFKVGYVCQNNEHLKKEVACALDETSFEKKY